MRQLIGWTGLLGAMVACAPVTNPLESDTASETSDAIGTATEVVSDDGGFPSDQTPLQTVQTEGGLDVSLWMDGEGLVRGTNAAWLRVEAAGEPVEGLALEVVPMMPSMGHGSHVTPVVTDLGAGRYRVEQIVFTMAGRWDLRIKITGSRTDEAVFALLVP